MKKLLSQKLYEDEGYPVLREHSDAAEELENRITELERLLARYRDETPLGNQPRMIAHEVDLLLGRTLNR